MRPLLFLFWSLVSVAHAEDCYNDALQARAHCQNAERICSSYRNCRTLAQRIGGRPLSQAACERRYELNIQGQNVGCNYQWVVPSSGVPFCEPRNAFGFTGFGNAGKFNCPGYFVWDGNGTGIGASWDDFSCRYSPILGNSYLASCERRARDVIRRCEGYTNTAQPYRQQDVRENVAWLQQERISRCAAYGGDLAAPGASGGGASGI